VNKATGKTKAKEGDKPKDKEEGESKKNILQKMMEGFGKLLEKLGEGINNPPPTPPPGDTISSAPGEAKLAAFVATMESSTLQDQADVMQSMINRAAQNHSGYGGLFGQLTAKNQYSPLSAAIHGTTDPDAQAKYGPVAAKLGRTPEERIAKIREIIAQPDGLAQLQSLFGGISSASMAKTLADDFYSKGPLSTEAARFIQGRTDFGAASGVGGAQGAGQIRRTSNTFAAANASRGASSLLTVAPPPAPLPPASQEIKENYGMKPHDKFEFVLGGQRYQAYKTTKGFDFFEITSNHLDANPKVTDPEKLKVLSEALRELKTKSPSAPPAPALPPAETSSLSPPPGSREIAEAISTPLDSTGQGNVVAMMLPQGGQPQTATTVTPSTHETATADRSRNDVKMSQIYLDSSTLS
jgi:hypothetical protein